MANVLTEEQKEQKRLEEEQRKDDIRAQLYDIELNLKRIDETVYYVSSTYNIDLSKAQELVKQLRQELTIE